MEEVITILKSEYESLQKSEMTLNALEQAGVDNWDGYSNAMEILEEWEKEENQ